MLRLNVEALELAADPDQDVRARAGWFAAAERAYGYLLAIHRDGWHAFCAARRIDGDALLRLLPSYPTVEQAERAARALAYTEAEMRGWLARQKGEGAEPKTAQSVSQDLEDVVRLFVAQWA